MKFLQIKSIFYSSVTNLKYLQIGSERNKRKYLEKIIFNEKTNDGSLRCS